MVLLGFNFFVLVLYFFGLVLFLFVMNGNVKRLKKIRGFEGINFFTEERVLGLYFISFSFNVRECFFVLIF